MPIGDRITPEMVAQYRAAGYWPTVGNLDLLDRNAERYPDKEALVDSRVRMTFGEFARASIRLGLAFHERGIRTGDIVVVQVPNSVDYMLILYGCRRIGGVPLFMTMDQRTHELRHTFERTEAVAAIILSDSPRFDYVAMYRDEVLPAFPRVKQVYVVGESVPPGAVSIRQLVDDPIETRYPAGYLDAFKPDLEHSMNLTSTSGTTGLPKFLFQKENTVTGKTIVDRIRATPDDVALVCAPLRGGGSNGYKYACQHVAMKGVLQERFDAEEALRLVERERATLLCAVPAQYIKMLDCPSFDRYDLSSLRLAYFAGALMPPDVAEQVRTRMKAEVVADYGAMDAGVFTVGSLEDPPEVRHHSVGRPIQGVLVRVVGDDGRELPVGAQGELQFGGPNIGRAGGYLKEPELTARAYTADDWYATGDLGRINPDGTVSIMGRKKDIIIRGGQNINPKEVEEMILAYPKVLDVSVVGMPDRVMGEKTCAFVIPRAGQFFTFDELVAFLRTQEIAAYKLPERLELLAELPMSADGQKVQKNVLRELVAKKLQEEGRL